MAQWLINIKHIDMPEVLAAIKDTVSGVWLFIELGAI
jgi:hypothetical protein